MKRSKFSHWPVVALSLVFALVFASCGKGCRDEGVSTDALKLIPKEHNILVELNWEKMMNSKHEKELQEKLPSELEELKDLYKDVKGVRISAHMDANGRKPDQFLAVLNGNFNIESLLEKIEASIKKEGGILTSEEYAGVKLYTDEKDPDMGFAFVASQGILGKKSSVKQAIDLSQGKGESIEKNEEVMKLVKNVDTSKMMWAVVSPPKGSLSQLGGAGSPVDLSKIEGFYLAVDLPGDLALDFGVSTQSADSAKQLESTVNSYKTMFGAPMAKQNPNVGKVLDNVVITTVDNRLELKLQMDEATLKEIQQQGVPF